MSDQVKLLINKFLSFSVGSWVSLIISLFSTPIITRLLSPEEFGIYSLFTVVLNLFLLFSLFGIDQSYVRFYYELSEIGKIKLLRICISFTFVISIVINFILIMTKDYSISIIFGTNEFDILLYFVLGVFISVLNRFVILLVRMEQQAKLYSLLQVLQKALDFLFFLFMYYWLFSETPAYHIPIVSYILAMLCVSLIGVLKNRSLWIKVFFCKASSEPKINFMKLINYGAPLGLTLLITWAFQFIDRIMLKELSGFGELGIYSAAFKLISILNIIQVSFTTFWVPVSNQKYIEEPNNKLFFSKMFSAVFIVMVTVGFAMILSKDLFQIFFGAKFEDAVELLPVLILIPIMYTLSEITVVGLNFRKRPKYHIFISIIVCIVNIVGNLLLIPLLGAKGAAISTGVSYVIFFFLRTHFGLKNYYFKAFSTIKVLLLIALIIFSILITLYS